MERFFDELPSAVVSYSFAIGCAAIAAIVVRAAAHIWFGF